jgi:hypothetical protein
VGAPTEELGGEEGAAAVHVGQSALGGLGAVGEEVGGVGAAGGWVEVLVVCGWRGGVKRLRDEGMRG